MFSFLNVKFVEIKKSKQKELANQTQAIKPENKKGACVLWKMQIHLCAGFIIKQKEWNHN